MTALANDLWAATVGRPAIDPTTLAAAVERQVGVPDLDYRTRLLIRDSLTALLSHWGQERFERWLNSLPTRDALLAVWRSDLGPPGFPTIRDRIMESLQPQTIREFLRELGERLAQPTRITVGGSIALILSGELQRATEDIDVVDEVPVEIRRDHQLLDELAKRFGLRIAHFQSHYLPSGWEGRLRSLGRFGVLDVDLVDSYDIFVGKLFSARIKDRDDLRMLARQLDKSRIQSRVRESASALSADSKLAANAATNWYIIYGEALPR